MRACRRRLYFPQAVRVKLAHANVLHQAPRAMTAFAPPPLLRSPHMQTIVSRWAPPPAGDLPAERVLLTCRDGVRLRAAVTLAAPSAPLVIVIHGWLGDVDSHYVVRVAAALRSRGFSVARLLLRDHGDTADLNRGMFNSARTGEVLDACNALMARCEAAGCHRGGIVGFSLGANFALRLGCEQELHPGLHTCLAISPVLDPEATVHAIDRGWVAYRLWFVRHWRRALAAKQRAFPREYADLGDVMRLSTVAAITDHLARRHLPFKDSRAYYAAYDLRGDRLTGLRIPARIVAALDDPVIPGDGYRHIARPPNLELELWPHGGHCGFVSNWRLATYVDEVAVRFFGAERC